MKDNELKKLISEIRNNCEYIITDTGTVTEQIGPPGVKQRKYVKELNRNLIDDRMQELEPGTQVRVIVVPILNKDEQIEKDGELIIESCPRLSGLTYWFDKDVQEYLDGLRRETGWFTDATISAPFASLMPMPNAVTKFIKEELDRCAPAVVLWLDEIYQDKRHILTDAAPDSRELLFMSNFMRVFYLMYGKDKRFDELAGKVAQDVLATASDPDVRETAIAIAEKSKSER